MIRKKKTHVELEGKSPSTCYTMACNL